MVELKLPRTNSRNRSSREPVFRDNLEENLHLNDPIPYEGWLPSEEQIRRFCEQLRSEPEWQDQHRHYDEMQSELDGETIFGMADRSSFRRRKTLSDLTTIRTNPILP